MTVRFAEELSDAIRRNLEFFLMIRKRRGINGLEVITDVFDTVERIQGGDCRLL